MISTFTIPEIDFHNKNCLSCFRSVFPLDYLQTFALKINGYFISVLGKEKYWSLMEERE